LSARRMGESSISSGPSGRVAQPRAALDAGSTLCYTSDVLGPALVSAHLWPSRTMKTVIQYRSPVPRGPTSVPGGHCPDASGLRWPAPGSAIGFGRTDLAIGNGTGCGTQPVGPNAAADIPVIALFPVFLALRASNCNGWARAWGFSGQGCERGPGKTM